VSNTKGAVLGEWFNWDKSFERLWSYPNGNTSFAARVDVRTLDVWTSVPGDVRMTNLGKAKDTQAAMDMADAWLEAHARLGLPRIEDVTRLYGEWLAADAAHNNATTNNDNDCDTPREAARVAFNNWKSAEKTFLLVAGMGVERWKERKARQKPQ